MSELRWTLLILGVVFIAALSWWERRRPRQAFAPRLREGRSLRGDLTPGGELRADRQERAAAPGATAPEGPAIGRVSGEPWIGDTELSDAVLSDVALTDAAETREPDGEGGAWARVERAAPSAFEELPTVLIPDEDAQGALQAAWDEAPPEPMLVDPEAGEARGAEPPAAVEPSPEVEIAGAEGVGAVRIVESAAPCGEGSAPVEPSVDWPPEEARRILAVRLVASPGTHFAGRALRLALAAEGFVLGKFAIFHKPDDANRAVLSAASLTRPGAFDLETMDSQRYAGLSLFAVLPGPRAPAQAFEELLAAARNLNERLEGALQDDRGGPLTALRVASLRESLKAEAANPPAPAAHGT